MIQNRKIPLTQFFLTCLLIIMAPTIIFSSSDDPALLINNQKITLSTLKQTFPVLSVTIAQNPAYNNQKKRYLAFKLHPILEKYFPELLNTKASTSLTLKVNTVDYYMSDIPLTLFSQNNKTAYLAFQEIIDNDTDPLSPDKRWTLVKSSGKILNPAPYYIVWNTTKDYPGAWPFSITSLMIIEKQPVPSLLPSSPGKQNKLSYQGLEIFMTHCARCHSLFHKGAQGKAPDLGYVTRYLPEDTIQNTIKNGFRFMPAIGKNFSQNEIKSLVAYLKWVAEHKPKC